MQGFHAMTSMVRILGLILLLAYRSRSCISSSYNGPSSPQNLPRYTRSSHSQHLTVVLIFSVIGALCLHLSISHPSNNPRSITNSAQYRCTACLSPWLQSTPCRPLSSYPYRSNSLSEFVQSIVWFCPVSSQHDEQGKEYGMTARVEQLFRHSGSFSGPAF